jgi:ribosome-associated translation inhibitor RaiA
MYAAIDAAFDKLERRISKLHDKLINNKARQAQKIAQAKREPQ